MVKVSIYNKQKALKISSALIRKQVLFILKHEKIKCAEIAINYVDEKTIKKLHKEFFNDPSSTDCITFPIDDRNDEKGFLGEIFICPKTALVYCRNKSDPFIETTLYLVHGILHLAGYNDIKASDKKIMKKKEKKCMKALKDTNLLNE